MKVAYLSYWGYEEGLTQASVIPHLKILADLEEVESIILFTIERSDYTSDADLDKVDHHPIYSRNFTIGLLNKINDFLLFPAEISRKMKSDSADLLICIGAPAAALGYLVYQRTKIPFVAESFEPHADYMLDAGVWSKNGLKYIFQKRWERGVINKASHIITVSKHYTEFLRKFFGAESIVFGCAVDLEKFVFYKKDRDDVRSRLGWVQETIGIYVGKFGDIYYQDEAYRIFKRAFDYFGDSFRLIILTPNSSIEIIDNCLKLGMDESKLFVTKVAHKDVPSYLSAADFAFSMVRPSAVRKFCSPIKDGEYWAVGLPILSAKDIGEDSDIILEHNAGALFSSDLENLEEAFEHIQNMIDLGERDRIRGVALVHRNFDKLPTIYQRVLS